MSINLSIFFSHKRRNCSISGGALFEKYSIFGTVLLFKKFKYFYLCCHFQKLFLPKPKGVDELCEKMQHISDFCLEYFFCQESGMWITQPFIIRILIDFPLFLQKSPKKLGKEPPFKASQYLETNWKPLVKKTVKYRPLIGRKRTYLGMGNQLGQYFFHFSLRIETDCNTINMIYRDRNFQFLVPGPGATLLGQHQSNHTVKVGIFFRF